ncbi:MAG: carotenoid biosynthesis protein [Armatimonadetes bacterium]|nr:carotenoid biosynthesis protein [Armatimonadota bacterium]
MPLSVPFRLFLSVVAFSVFGLMAQKITGTEALWVARIASLLMTFFGAWTTFRFLDTWPGALWIKAVGAIAEVVGIFTGFPFGHYAYTPAWWPAIALPGQHYYPLVLPLAWLMILTGSLALASKNLAQNSRVGLVLGSALIATFSDASMEWVMAGPLGYWIWQSPNPILHADWRNPLGWFGVSVLALVPIPFFYRKPDATINSRLNAQNEAIAVLLIFLAFTQVTGFLSR